MYLVTAIEESEPAAAGKSIVTVSGGTGINAEVTVKGDKAEIVVVDKNGEETKADKVVITSVTALKQTGAEEVSVKLDKNLIVEFDIEDVDKTSTSDTITIVNNKNTVTVKSGSKEIITIEAKELIADANAVVTVKYTEETIQVLYGDVVVFDIDISDIAASNGKLTVKFADGKIKVFNSKGELLITIMSSLAQEESRSISENVTWGNGKEVMVERTVTESLTQPGGPSP